MIHPNGVTVRNFTWVAAFLGVLGVSLLSACTLNRKLATVEPTPVPAATEIQNSNARPEEDPSEVVSAEGNPVELVIKEARNLFSQGESLFIEGQTEEGRQYFQRSLQTLKDSGFDFFSHPRIESAYYLLLSQQQEYEIQALIDPLEIQPFNPEPAPLDEIAGLNLYTIKVDSHLEQLMGEDLLESRFDIPVVLNDSVVRFLNYYQTRGREVMEEGLRRSGRYLPLFREIFEKEGVPKDLIYMAHVESLFKPRAYSRAKARGIWQFIGYTGRQYGLRQDWWIDERSDVIKSTHAAARHLKDLYEQFEDWSLALAGYNSGANRIGRILRRYGPMDYWTMVKRKLLPRETRNYVPSILASLIIFRHPERYGFRVVPEEPMKFDLVPLKEQVDLSVAAAEIGVPVSKLTEFNPELRRGITPIDYPEYRLKVPLGKGELLLERLASLPPEKKVRFEHHKVRRGDTLSMIAGKYSSSIQAIAQVNHIRNVHRLRIGQHLIIPLSGLRSSPRSWSGRQVELPDTYVVRRGDTLAKIARMYRVRLGDVLRWNGLKVRQIIYPGQRIRILDESELARTPVEAAGDQ